MISSAATRTQHDRHTVGTRHLTTTSLSRCHPPRVAQSATVDADGTLVLIDEGACGPSRLAVDLHLGRPSSLRRGCTRGRWPPSARSRPTSPTRSPSPPRPPRRCRRGRRREDGGRGRRSGDGRADRRSRCFRTAADRRGWRRSRAASTPTRPTPTTTSAGRICSAAADCDGISAKTKNDDGVTEADDEVSAVAVTFWSRCSACRRWVASRRTPPHLLWRSEFAILLLRAEPTASWVRYLLDTETESPVADNRPAARLRVTWQHAPEMTSQGRRRPLAVRQARSCCSNPV